MRLESRAEKGSWGICTKLIASVHRASALPACRVTHVYCTADTHCSTGNTTQQHHLFSSSPLPMGLCSSSDVKWLNDSMLFVLMVACHAWYFALVNTFYFLPIRYPDISIQWLKQWSSILYKTPQMVNRWTSCMVTLRNWNVCVMLER